MHVAEKCTASHSSVKLTKELSYTNYIDIVIYPDVYLVKLTRFFSMKSYQMCICRPHLMKVNTLLAIKTHPKTRKLKFEKQSKKPDPDPHYKIIPTATISESYNRLKNPANLSVNVSFLKKATSPT